MPSSKRRKVRDRLWHKYEGLKIEYLRLKDELTAAKDEARKNEEMIHLLTLIGASLLLGNKEFAAELISNHLDTVENAS